MVNLSLSSLTSSSCFGSVSWNVCESSIGTIRICWKRFELFPWINLLEWSLRVTKLHFNKYTYTLSRSFSDTSNYCNPFFNNHVRTDLHFQHRDSKFIQRLSLFLFLFSQIINFRFKINTIPRSTRFQRIEFESKLNTWTTLFPRSRHVSTLKRLIIIVERHLASRIRRIPYEPAHLLRPLDISANVSKVVTPEESKGGARVWIGRTCVNSQWSVHRLARNAGVGYKLRPLLSPHQAPATLPPLAENARLLCMKWLWRVWCEVARPRATSRSSLRLARWQLQNVPAAPSPSAKRRLYPRQRGCSPLFSRRKISRVSRGMIDRRCISIVRFCIVVLLEISRCVESTNWVLLFFILLSLWTRLICDIQARCSFRNT